MNELRTDASSKYGKLLVADDAEMLARTAADRLLAWMMDTNGPVRIALSGGSTPRRTYEELAGSRLIRRVPWPRLHWYWGDERFVPPDHPDSNFRMVREAMLDVAPVPVENIHPIPTQNISAAEAATEYERELRRAYGGTLLQSDRPLFDICLLGLGNDGHAASLLPGDPVLQEREHWVSAVAHGRPETRITLTYPAINSSRHVAFLVSGESKRPILREVLSGSGAAPAARLDPLGDLTFIADRAAAGQ